MDTPVPCWYLPEDSKVRTVAMQIIAMRIAGFEDDDIAKHLHISPKSISPYVYRAGKNGWLDIDNPKDRLQYVLLHKVMDNIAEGLASTAVLNTGMKEKTHVALKVAEGTVFKQFADQAAPIQHQTVVALRIEMPAGPVQTMREDTTGGVPAYIDVEPV